MDLQGAPQGQARHQGYAERVRRKVRRYRPDTDREALLALRRAAWGDVTQASGPYLDWRYPAVDGEFPLWVVAEKGAIVAAEGAVPVSLSVAGTSYRAAWFIELFVDPRHRWRGLGAALTQVASEGFEVTMGTELSDGGWRTFGHAGWTELGTLPLWVRPLDLDEVLAVRLPGKVPAGVRRLAGPALRAADVALDGVLALTGLSVREVDRFGDEVDGLWRAVGARYPVVGRRDAAVLNHAFASYPDPTRYRRLVFHRGGRLVGWSVLHLGERHGLASGDVVDFLAAPGFTLPVLARSLRVLARAGARMAYVIHLGPDADALRWLGFSRRDSRWRTMVNASDLPAADRARVSRREGWYLTAGDSNLHRPRE